MNLPQSIDQFGELYSSYFQLLYNYAVTITNDPMESEDIVGEVFLKLYEERENISIKTSLKSYLFKSTYNECINTLKHRKVHEKYEDYLNHLEWLNREETSYPLSSLIDTEITETLQKAIEKLPQQCRTIFILSRNEHLTHSEIARELGVSINTVHMQIRRALEKLRIELKDFLSFLLFYF
ncbi:MAG: RNA polymerase sigma-70 factor [Dysgonamonadaceae bacterium]|nr:RNA polymerase sigma-70 factor [Dysgonamonadaceae bacterium]